MKLKKLLTGLEWSEKINPEISSIATDSRKVEKNGLFVAINGVNIDGNLYIPEAIKKGANVVITENDYPDASKSPKVTFIKVKNARIAAAIIASNYYGNVHKHMKLIGVTGTNGKTTTSELTYQLLKKQVKGVGVISTVSAKFSGSELDTGYHVTTPDVIDLHKLISDMYKKGCKYLIVETTSHGLDQHRTWGLTFELACVTNVTPEHLDYHKTFDRYLKTKAKIFDQSKFILLNKSDPALHKLLNLLPKHANYAIVDYTKLKVPQSFTKTFPGQYNLENAAMAHTIVKKLLGKATIKTFGKLEGVKGRMEVVKTNQNFDVIIDFAHDATALENILKVTRKLTKNKLILVFGCAGLRDKLKRPKMGFLAVKLADQFVITAEDPRTEDLTAINNEIESGAIKAGGKKAKDYFVIDDRQRAIDFAINKLANQGDLVLITGKGHETSMCFGVKEFPWSDVDAVNKALKL